MRTRRVGAPLALATAVAVALALTGARAAMAAFGPPTRVATLPAYPGPDTRSYYASCRTAAGTLIEAGSLGALRSVDDGLSWSPIVGLPGGWNEILRAGPVSTHAIWTDSTTSYGVRRSTDDGVTWTPLSVPAVASNDFDAAIAPDDGRLAFVWSDASEVIQVITSTDDGLSWSPSQALGAGVDVSAAWDGAGNLLVCSDVWTQPWTARDVVCHTSRDRGASFDPPVVVLTDTVTNGSVSRPGVTARGPADFLLLATSGVTSAIWVVASADAGSTWSVVTWVPGTYVENLETRAGWTWASCYRSAQNGTSLFIVATSDGSTWRTIEAARDSLACTDVMRGAIHPGAPGEAVLAGGQSSWRTVNAGATWDLGRAYGGPVRPPAQDVRAVRLPTGRWVAFWSDGQGSTAPLLASISDDDGASFAAPTVASDRPRNTFVERLGFSVQIYQEHRNFDVAVTTDGEIVLAWLAADEAGCSMLRVSRSPDGILWAPSVALGEIYQWQLPITLADDGAGRLACVWTDPAVAVVASRSTDGGSTWSPPRVLFPPGFPGAMVTPTTMVGTSAGSFVFLAAGAGPGWQDVQVARSTDGGSTWGSWVAGSLTLDVAIDGVLLAAGSRLVAGIHGDCSTIGGFCVSSNLFESNDDGLTWAVTPFTSIDAEGLRAGDALGNIYYYDVWTGGRLHVQRPAGPDLDLGPLPASNVLHDVVVPAPGEVRVLWADWSASTPPGVFSAGMAPAALLRDASIGALSPRPDIAALFPLAPYAAVAFPGMTDPDPLVLGDVSRPLVFYALGGNTVSPLLVTKRAGLLHLDW